MDKQFKKLKREKKSRLYSKFYPHQTEIDYDQEQIYFKNMIWSIIQNKEFKNDKQLVSVNLKFLLKKFKSIYFLTHLEKEKIVSILFENSFNLFYINTDHRIEFMKLLNQLLKTKKPFKNLIIDWKILYHFFMKQYKSNEIFVMQGEEILLLQLQEIFSIIKRSRKYFEESSIDEVYNQIFKRNFNPSEFSLGISLLSVFLKTDSQIYDYRTIFEELIEFIFYRFNHRDTLFMFIIKEIIQNQKNRIDFSIYYERLFYIILNHMNNLLRNDFQDEVNKDEKLFEILLNDPVTDIKCTFKSIPDIIIGLLVPSSSQHYDTVWSYIERIFNLIDSLLNPSNQADWNNDIFKFIKYFVRKFIKRYNDDSKLYKKLQSISQNGNAYLSDSNSDSLIESDESDKEDIIEQNSYKKIKTSQNSLLDEPNKERFMALILKLINKLIFFEDNGYGLPKIFLYLSHFDPIKFYPVFFEGIYRTLESDHKMTYTTIKNCFLLQINPLILKNKSGIQKCFQFFQQSFKLFKIQGVMENLDLIEIYNKFLQYFPLNSYQQLIQEFELQKEITEDQIQLLKDIEKWILELFELLVNNLEFLEFQNESEQMTLVIDIQNLFKTIIVQSSNFLRIKFLDIIFQRLESQIFKQSNIALSHILSSYSLVEPEIILSKIFALLMNKIVKPRTQSQNSMESLDKIKKHSLYFMIENLPNRDNILSYEIEIQNNDSLLFYLELLESSITYANKYLIPYDDQLQIIIYLLIFEEENFIFEKSCDILHTLLISLINDYIIDQYYINDDEKNLKQNKYLYIKKAKKSNIFNLKPIWNSPGQQERLYAQKWVQNIVDCILNYFNSKYFNENFQIFDYKIQQNELINKLIFHKPEENTQKKEFYRTIFLVVSVISAINWKIPFFSYCKNDLKNYIYLKFEKTQMFSEYDGYRDKILHFLLQVSTLFFQKDMFHDNLISQSFHLLFKETFFDNFPIDEVKKSKEHIEGINAIEDQFKSKNINIRFYQLLELSSKYQERTILFLFTFFENCGFPEQIENILYLEYILGFNPIYSFKHTFYYHYQQLNNIFHEEHITMLELFYEQLSSGILQKYKESPIYEKGVQFIINNIRRIKFIWNQRCCPYDTRLIDRLIKILSLYGLLEQKALKELFLDPFLKLFTLGYQDSQFIENKFYKGSSIIKSSILQQENNIFDHSEKLSNEQKQFYRQHYYNILEKLSVQIEDQQIHWKLKTTYGLFSMCLMNNFDKLNHFEEPVIIKLLEQFIQFSISDNIHLQQLGRSCILRTLNQLKRIQIFQNNHLLENQNSMNNEDQSRSLEEFLKWHFLKKEFLSNNAIHCKYQGFFSDLDQNQNKKNKQILLKQQQIQENKFILTLKKYFCDQSFMEKFIKKILLDKNLSINSDNDDDALHQIIEENGLVIFNHLQILFLFFFDKDLKKFFSFSSSYAFIFSEFYQKFFKKLFQFFDDDFFQSTSKIIENCFNSQTDQRENQKLTLYYISALLKTMSKQNDVIENNEFNYKKYEIIYNYANNISLLAIAQSNQEFFREWLECFSYFARNNDIRITEYFFSSLITKSRSMNQAGLRFRYYQIIKEFIKQNTYRSRKIAFEALQNIQNDYQINDKSECDEITDLIVHILSYAICIPLNYKKLQQEQWIEGGVQQYIDNKQLFVLNDITLFENNVKIKEFFQFLIQKLKLDDDEESLKLYSYLAFQIMESIIIKRQNDLFWSYFQDLFDFLIDNQMVDIDDKQILQKISDSYFPQNLRNILTEILNSKIDSGSWPAKQKCLLFSREFFFYKHFLSNYCHVDSIFLKAFLDDNQTIQINSIKSLADVLKISKDEEFQIIFDQYQNNANIELPIGKYVLDYKNNIIIKKQGLYVLMALILATQERVFKWIQIGLEIILKNQKLSQAIKKTTQDFFSLYWQNKQECVNFDQLGIENQMIEQIKEVANPYSYFS